MHKLHTRMSSIKHFTLTHATSDLCYTQEQTISQHTNPNMRQQ